MHIHMHMSMHMHGQVYEGKLMDMHTHMPMHMHAPGVQGGADGRAGGGDQGAEAWS